MNRKFIGLISVAIILFSVGIGQLIFVFSARSSLIWTHYPSGLTDDEIIYLPKNTLNPNKYLIVFYARHVYIGS